MNESASEGWVRQAGAEKQEESIVKKGNVTGQRSRNGHDHKMDEDRIYTGHYNTSNTTEQVKNSKQVKHYKTGLRDRTEKKHHMGQQC